MPPGIPAGACPAPQAVLHVLARILPAVLPRLSRLAPIFIFVALYIATEVVFSCTYFSAFSGWRPAFPATWRFLLMLLFVVPIFAFVQILRRVLPLLLDRRNRSAGHVAALSQLGYVLLHRDHATERDVEELFVADEDGDENVLPENPRTAPERRSQSLSPISRHPVPHDKQWWAQVFAYLLLFCVSTWVGVHHERPGDVRYRAAIRSAVARPRREGYGKQEKIFVAVMFHNNERVIPYWHDSLIKTIHYLGPDNVFVSIVESQSTDSSPQLLDALDADLARIGVLRRILTRDDAVRKPDDMSGNNRTEYLAAVRNRALEPLVTGGYDKVVFSNDIFIEPESLVELLETNGGDYDMACGLDFQHFGAYDMWVLRDRQAHLVSAIWPYFIDEVDYRAMQTDSPAPVFSCWNGIAVFTADPFLPIALRSNRTLSDRPLPHELPPTHPAAHNASMRGPTPALTPPLKFRASAPGECYSSESFLLPYDLRRLFDLQRIYVNPRVINAYQWSYYVYFKWFMRHPALQWWIEKVYNGAWMARAVFIVGDPVNVYRWDGGDCYTFT